MEPLYNSMRVKSIWLLFLVYGIDSFKYLSANKLVIAINNSLTCIIGRIVIDNYHNVVRVLLLYYRLNIPNVFIFQRVIKCWDYYTCSQLFIYRMDTVFFLELWFLTVDKMFMFYLSKRLHHNLVILNSSVKLIFGYSS